MASTTTSTTVCIICWIIINLIILPYDAYWLYKFWQNRNALIIQKRKPNILVLKELSLWIYIIFFFTLEAIIFQNNGVSDDIKNILIFIIDIVLSPLIWTNALLHVVRYWLINYMINLNAAIIHNKWQSVINPTSKTRNWYLENKKKWGSWKFVRKIIIIYGTISWFICVFPLILVLGGIYNIVLIIFIVIAYFVFIVCAVLIPVSIYIYILWKTPKLNDDIGIRAELRFSIYTILSVMLLTGLLVIISFIAPKSWDQDDFCILFYIWFTMLRCVFLMSSLKHTKWPLSTFEEIVVGRHSDTKMVALAHQDTYNKIDENTMMRSIENEYIALRKEMRNILQNGELFDLFMIQLLNEYCAECLLSIIEFIQFKRKIINDNKDIIFDENDLNSIIILPSTCPQSYIIFGDEDPNYKDNYKYMAKKLYKRYIRIGAEWEINIDYHNRNRYRDIFENKKLSHFDDKKELYILFNPCIDHMMSLIASSFTRFRNSKQYKMTQQYSPPLHAHNPVAKLSNAIKLIPRFSKSSKGDHIPIINVDQSIIDQQEDEEIDKK